PLVSAPNATCAAVVVLPTPPLTFEPSIFIEPSPRRFGVCGPRASTSRRRAGARPRERDAPVPNVEPPDVDLPPIRTAGTRVDRERRLVARERTGNRDRRPGRAMVLRTRAEQHALPVLAERLLPLLLLGERLGQLRH